jgi:hypothetical protein
MVPRSNSCSIRHSGSELRCNVASVWPSESHLQTDFASRHNTAEHGAALDSDCRHNRRAKSQNTSERAAGRRLNHLLVGRPEQLQVAATSAMIKVTIFDIILDKKPRKSGSFKGGRLGTLSSLQDCVEPLHPRFAGPR